jgi:predicted acylesterase/phospholipase RssA
MLAALSAITQISSRTRLPLLLFLTCLFIGLSLSDVNDHHAVRLASKASTAGPTPDITQAFRDWLAVRADAKSKERYPVFVVAAEGGGVRAAVMTAMVLDELRHDEKFVSHLFAMVGVSGGSVGASTFAVAVRQNLPALHPKEAVSPAQSGRTNWQSALHVDLLSPTLRTLLGLDLLTHLWPRDFSDMSVWDRTRTLEETLASHWKNATGQELLNVSFDGMRPRRKDPALVLMTTSVANGQPVAISHLGHPGFSTLEAVASDVRVPLITAAFMSARFPIITPAALVLTNGETQRYVDGGYFENSGVTAATELIQAIKDEAALKSVRFIVLRIVNGSTEEVANSQKSSYFSEITAPLLALYRTNDARERSALKALRGLEEQHLAGGGCEQVGTGPKIEEITFRLVPRKEVPLPLGWYLSAGARREIAAQLGEAANRKCFEAVTRTLIEAQ